MTISKIYRAEDTGVAANGFIWYPGSINNYARHSRSAISVFTHLGYTVRVRPEDMTVDHVLAGWASSFASFRLISNRTLTVSAYSGGAVGGAASDVIPFDPVGVDVWFKGEVRVLDAVCSYWYSLDDVEDPSLVTWIPLGTPTGSRPGLTPSTSNSNLLQLGATSPTGVTGLFQGRIYYFSEQQNQVDSFVVNFHDKLTLPSTVALLNTGTAPGVTFHPETTLAPEEYDALWVGDKRVWPIRDGWVNHGVAAGGNYSAISTPAIAGYTTTDLDVRWFGKIDWTRSGGVFNQWDVAGNQRAWLMEMGGGQTRLSFSTTGANQFMTPLVNFPYAAGQSGGIRFTRVQSTGLVRLYFSTDGITWVENVAGQATVAAGTAMFASTAPVMFGAYNSLGSAGQVVGNTHYAELRNGIDGAAVFRHGPESLRNLTRKQASWTCETGQVVTRVGGGSPGPWVYPTVDVEDIIDQYEGEFRTWPGADGYAEIPITEGNFLSTPHNPTYSITGDICIVARVHCVDWTLAFSRSIVSKWGNIYGGYSFGVNNIARLSFSWSPSPGTSTVNTMSTVSVPDVPGWLWVAVSVVVAGREIKYWTSIDGVNWTQLGTTVTGAATDIAATTDPVRIGVLNGFDSNCFNGRIGHVSIRSGVGAGNTVGGTTVLHMDRDSFKVGRRATTIPAVAQVINPKSSTTYAGVVTTPDPGVPPDQFILIAEVTAGPNNGGGTIRTIASHGAATPNYAWRWVWVDNSTTAKTLRVVLSADGTAVTNFSVANIVPHAEGARYWMASSMEKVGANWTIIVYESENGTTWTNRGTATAAFGTIFDTAADLSIGASNGSFLGELHSVEMRTGLDPNAGTVLWKLEPDDSTMAAATYRQPEIVDLDYDGITDGWTPWVSGTVSGIRRTVAAGIQYIEAVLGSNPSFCGVTSPRFPILPSTTYSCSVMWFLLQTAASCGFSLRARAYDAGGVFLQESLCIAISGGGGTPNDTTNTFSFSAPSAVSAELCVGMYLTNVATPGITKVGFLGARVGPASSYVDPRGRTWTYTNLGAVGSTVAYDPVSLAVNKSGSPQAMIYPTVSEMGAKWGLSQWGDGTKWVA